MSEQELYPSFDNLIDKPTSIMYRPEDGIVVGMGQLILDNQAVVVLRDTREEDFVAGLDILYPMWRREKAVLGSPTSKEYSTQIVDITRSWANTHLASQFHKLKYIPPGYESQWKEAQLKKAPPQQYFVNPLCINGKYALVGIKVNESDKLRVAFSKIDGTVKGFYRASTLELKYIANACFIGNTGKGFVATARAVFCFEINPDLSFTVHWSIDNPTYPTGSLENIDQQLDAAYPEIVMTASETLLVIAKYGQPFYVINLADTERITEIPMQTTSVYIADHEIACGTANGQVHCYTYTLTAKGIVKMKLRPKRTRSLCKDWKLHDGTEVPVPVQGIQALMVFKAQTVAALENAFILSDWNSSVHAVVNNVERIVCLALIGDLVVSLSSSYNLFFTQLVQSVPVKRDPLFKTSPAAPRGRQLLYADPNMVCVLALDGTIVQTLLQK